MFLLYIHRVWSLIICKIAKINDAIGDVEFVKTYYSDMFNTNKKYLNFIANCDDLNYSLEKRRNELISQFQDFIEEIYKKDELRDLFKDELFNLDKLLNEIKKGNSVIGISKIISYLEQWLDIISYEEMRGNMLELLNDELKDFYEKNL